MSQNVRTSGLLHTMIGKMVVFFAVYTGFYTVFGGAIRGVLAKAHLLFINNIPAIAAVILFCAYFIDAAARRQMSRFMMVLLIIIIFFLVYAMGTQVGALQTAMGFYIWTYFLLGVLVCMYQKEETLFKFTLILWGLSVFGVLLNYYVSFPWIGESYEVAGTTMKAARDWSAEGDVNRLPGFSRTSAEVAADILIFGAYLITARRYAVWLKVPIYILSCLSIYLTTSKTELGLILIFPFLLLTYRGLKMVMPKSRAAFNFARSITWLMVFLIIFLPAALSTHRQIQMTGPLYGFITGDSFIDRMTHMWPEAFDILNKDGNPFFGRGIGGIGAGLSMLDPKPDEVNSADNLFVYMYVEGGIFFVTPLFLGFLVNIGYLYRKNEEYFEVIWALTFCVLGIAVMAAAVEETTSAIMIGFLVARGYVRNETAPLRI